MEYKGYRVGYLAIDEDAGVIHGRLALPRGIVTFESETAIGAVEAFRASVDDYLAACADFGVEPEAPAIGDDMMGDLAHEQTSRAS